MESDGESIRDASSLTEPDPARLQRSCKAGFNGLDVPIPDEDIPSTHRRVTWSWTMHMQLGGADKRFSPRR